MTITFKHSLVRNGQLVKAGTPVEVDPSEIPGFQKAGFRFETPAEIAESKSSVQRSAEVVTKGRKSE
jgi:hypothetical protein